jgi:osmotically-inducible protein OsmY
VFNEITVKSSVKPQAIEQKISAAFQRNARLDARQITVTATDGTAHLYGHVRSLGEKWVAADTAFDAPGVVSVDNQLSVVP